MRVKLRLGSLRARGLDINEEVPIILRGLAASVERYKLTPDSDQEHWVLRDSTGLTCGWAKTYEEA